MAYGKTTTGKLVEVKTLPPCMQAIIRFEMEAEQISLAAKKGRKLELARACNCAHCKRILTHH